MENNFNNESNVTTDLSSGFEPPSSNDPLNLGYEETYVQMQPMMSSDNLADVKPKKSHKGLIIALASIGTIIAACICCVLFIPSVNNTFKLYTQKPATYYQGVEKDNIEKNLNENSEHIKELTSYMSKATNELATMEGITDLQKLSDIPWANSTGYCNMEIAISDEFKSLIKSLTTKSGAPAIVDELIASVKSVSFSGITTISEKEQISMDISFTLNNSKIISANVILDVKNLTIYFAVPEVIDTVFSFTIPEQLINQLKGDLETLPVEITEVYKKIDDAVTYIDDNSDELIAFIEKYSTIIVETLDEAEINKKTEVDVNEVAVEYTEIVVKIDQAKAIEIGENVLSELKDDDFVKGLVEKLGAKDQYTESIEELLADVKDTKITDSDVTIDLFTYVNSKGEIVGRAIESKGTRFSFITYERDDENQFQFTFTTGTEDNSGSVSLKGKCNGEDAKTGYVMFECDVEEYDFNVKCEFEDAKVVNDKFGYFNGKYTITTNFPELEPFAIVIDAEGSDDSQKASFDVLYNNDKTITLTFETGTKDFEEIKLPENTFEITTNITEENALEILKKVNLVNIKDNIKNALKSDSISTMIDEAFTEAGLDAADGSMTDEEAEALVNYVNPKTTIDYDSDTEVIFNDDLTINEDLFDDDDYYEVDDDRTSDDGDPSMFWDAYNNGLAE